MCGASSVRGGYYAFWAHVGTYLGARVPVFRCLQARTLMLGSGRASCRYSCSVWRIAVYSPTRRWASTDAYRCAPCGACSDDHSRTSMRLHPMSARRSRVSCLTVRAFCSIVPCADIHPVLMRQWTPLHYTLISPCTRFITIHTHITHHTHLTTFYAAQCSSPFSMHTSRPSADRPAFSSRSARFATATGLSRSGAKRSGLARLGVRRTRCAKARTQCVQVRIPEI